MCPRKTQLVLPSKHVNVFRKSIACHGRSVRRRRKWRQGGTSCTGPSRMERGRTGSWSPRKQRRSSSLSKPVAGDDHAPNRTPRRTSSAIMHQYIQCPPRSHAMSDPSPPGVIHGLTARASQRLSYPLHTRPNCSGVPATLVSPPHATHPVARASPATRRSPHLTASRANARCAP